MKITYDERADALNIVFKEGKVARTVEVAPEVLVDLDDHDTPLYVEIIGASEKIGKKNFSDVSVGDKVVPMSALAA